MNNPALPAARAVFDAIIPGTCPASTHVSPRNSSITGHFAPVPPGPDGYRQILTW